MSNQAVIAELSRLETAALIPLYILDATDQGGDLLFFYAGIDRVSGPIVWQGVEYQPIPLEVRGYGLTGEGAPPRPTVVFANIGGAFSGLVLAFDDLLGARFIRKRVFARYLDGMPEADPTKALPDDVFYIERKISENRFSVEFELGTSLDVEDTMVPKRIIYANLCSWEYRGEGCGYASDVVKADVFDNQAPAYGTQNFLGLWSAATTYHELDVVYIVNARGMRRYFWCFFDNLGAGISGAANGTANGLFWTADECSRRIQGCAYRFAQLPNIDPNGLPYGGFPATARLSA